MLKLHGHSGCYIEYHAKRVRKGTTESGYALRLKRQAEKQTRFIALNVDLDEIDIPRVGMVKEGEDYFWFDMPYVAGLSGIEFLKYGDKSNLDWLVECIATFIDRNFARARVQEISRKVLVDKVDELSSKCSYEAVETLRRACMALPENIAIPVGPCHGDLTLSNMIIDLNHKKVWLIDFLDCFVESPLWDVAKIRQDTVYKWIHSCTGDSFDLTKSDIALDYMDEKFTEYCSRKEWYPEHYPFFQAFNLARVLPYIKEAHLVQKLTHSIKDLLHG